MKLHIFLILSVLPIFGYSEMMPIRQLATISFDKYPAFLELFQENDDPDRQILYISTFAPLTFQPDPIYYLRNPGQFLSNPQEFIDNLVEDTGLDNYWPNNPDFMPYEVMQQEGVIWTSGFLVPGKKEGRLNLYFPQDDGFSPPVNIASKDTTTYSYHRVLWKDMDSDGDLDALTARFHVTALGGTSTDFSWLENPYDGPTEGWEQHHLCEGPDVHFRNIQMPNSDGSKTDAFVAGEFWNEEVKIWWTENNNWNDINIEYNIKSKLIDPAGQVFDVYVSDFNMDGKEDVLATVYDKKGKEGYVYVYQFDENWRQGNWSRTTIADGFIAAPIPFAQSMTPGSPKPFYPSVAYENMETEDGRKPKPYIALSGDDDGKLYVLTPDSEDPNDWSYTKNVLVDTEATTSGKLAIGDMDRDGYTDIIGAGYSAKKFYVFTYAPE